jgi:hypothetical protein
LSTITSFEAYSKKVFHFDDFLSSLCDERINPPISIQSITNALFLSSAFRIKAISTIEFECRSGILKKKIGPISDDTFGYGLAHLSADLLREKWRTIQKVWKRNGMLKNNPFNDWMIGVLDCIEISSSYERHCPRCMVRHITKDGRDVEQYYHRASILILVGFEFPIPVDMELMRPGEEEVSCGLRLLKRVVEQLGVRFIDAVIGDAFYCKPKFFHGCRNLGLCAGAVLKENQQNLLESSQVMREHSEPFIFDHNEKGEYTKVWELKNVFWDTADMDVRVIWAEKRVCGKIGTGKQKTSGLLDKKNVFVFCKEMDALPAHILYKISCHRWDIDATFFQDFTKNWHLKHPTLHFENAFENMIIMRLIAYSIFMFFFFRHINSRRKIKIPSFIQLARMLYQSACAIWLADKVPRDRYF